MTTEVFNKQTCIALASIGHGLSYSLSAMGHPGGSSHLILKKLLSSAVTHHISKLIYGICQPICQK